MERDEARREAAGRGRKAVGRDRGLAGRELDGGDAERGGEDAAELRVLGALQDRRAGRGGAQGAERGEEQDGVADAAGAHGEDAAAGEVAQCARLGLALGAGERGAEGGAEDGVERLEETGAGGHGRRYSWAGGGRIPGGTSAPSSMRRSSASANVPTRGRERGEILSSVSWSVCQ